MSAQATFSWRCPICGHLNIQPADGARLDHETPCCGLSSHAADEVRNA